MIKIGLFVNHDLASKFSNLIPQALHNKDIQIDTYSDKTNNLILKRFDICIVEYRLMMNQFYPIDLHKAISDSLVIYVMDTAEPINTLIPLLPFNYIREPIDEENFLFIIKCAYHKLVTIKSHNYPCHINGGITYIDLLTTKYFVSCHRKVIARSITNSELSFYAKLDDIEQSLSEYGGFARISKSYLVNLDCIEKFNSSCIVIDGETFSISRRLKDNFLMILSQHKKDIW